MADDLELAAGRARTRGGAAAAAAFLERAAELTPSPAARGQRLIEAAEARHDAGAPQAALRLLDTADHQPLSIRQQALVARLRARAQYALRRDSDGPRLLLAAAQGLEDHDPFLARDTYIEALSAAIFGGRLGDPDALADVSNAILDATAADDSDEARDLLLRGQALLAADGQVAAISTLRRALDAYLAQPPDTPELHWMWFASRAAQDLWDPRALRTLADRQVEAAARAGVLTVLPIALSLLMLAQTVDGDLAAADASCDEIDAIKNVDRQPSTALRTDVPRRLSREPDEVADSRPRFERTALHAARGTRSAPPTSPRRSSTTASDATRSPWPLVDVSSRTRASSTTPCARSSS